MHALYMDDSYLKEFSADVTEVNGDLVVLDDTAFYPSGGGVPNDTGFLMKGDDKFSVTNVTKSGGKIFHHVSGHNLSPGDKVTGVLNWDRRYTLMRHHTSAHLLASIFHSQLGVLITGNQLDTDKSRMDFSMENFDKTVIDSVFQKANEAIATDSPVKIYYLSKEEAMKIPGVIKLANAMPPDVENLRIVEIAGWDLQADGGCHVSHLKEIGRIEFLKADNKGKNNRRIYYTVK